jgi:hypothetical protein
MPRNKTLKKGGRCACSKKIFSGGNNVTPEMSGYKMNEGIGGMNDPQTNLLSSRLVSGGKKRKTMRKKRKTKSKRSRK